MHKTEKQLINVFSQSPQRSFTTSELVSLAFSDDYHAIRDQLHSNDTETKKHAKRHKAKLHRKLLYHLNKLLKKGILRVDEIQARGEKSYALAQTSGETIYHDKESTITITHAERPPRYTTGHEEAKRIYVRSTALHTIDAYAINAKAHPGIAHLRQELIHAYPHINDAILISNAQHLLELGQEAMSAGIAQLEADTQDYEVAITLHIDLTQQQLTQRHLAFFRTFALHKPSRVYIVFGADAQTLKTQQTIFTQILDILSADKIKINIQNNTQTQDIHFYGEAGSYLLTQAHKHVLDKHHAVIVANTSMLIDAQQAKNASTQTQIINDAMRTMLSHISAQRRLAHKALSGIARSTELKEQLSTPTAIIRYYSFSLEESTIALFSDIKKQIQQFSEIHNRIYASCGVPIDLQIQLSTGFIHYADLPARTYKKTPVKSKSDLSTQQLRLREQLLRAMQTDRVRIFRETPYSPQDLFNEIVYLLEQYSIPLICYDLQSLQTTLSLEQFL